MAKVSPGQTGGQPPFQVRVLNIQITSNTKGQLSGAVTISVSPPEPALTLNFPFEGMPSLDDGTVAAVRSLREWAEGVVRGADGALSGN